MAVWETEAPKREVAKITQQIGDALRETRCLQKKKYCSSHSSSGGSTHRERAVVSLWEVDSVAAKSKTEIAWASVFTVPLRTLGTSLKTLSLSFLICEIGGNRRMGLL